MATHVMYHGTTYPNIDKFKGRRGVAGHFAFDNMFARSFAHNAQANAEERGEEGDLNPQIYPVHISAKRLFDARNPEHMNEIGVGPRKDWDFRDLERHVPDMKKTGFDSFLDFEHGTHYDDGEPMNPSGIAVFHPHQVKSAIGNNGHFDPHDPDITKSGGGDVEGMMHPAHAVHGIHVGSNVMFTGTL